MTYKAIIPPSSLTHQLSPDLQEIPPFLNKKHKFGAHRLSCDDGVSMPTILAGFTDGHRLLIPSTLNERNVINSYVIYFYILGGIGLAISISSYLSGNFIPDELWYTIISSFILLIGIILTINKLRQPTNQYVVFDRDTGNVLFTARKKWPDLVVPFDKVGCYTDHMLGRAALHFYSKLECLMRPKFIKRGRRVELFSPGLVNNWQETMKQWAYINRFMDKSQPIPQTPEDVWLGIKWFAERNITLDDMMNKYGHIEGDPELEWFKWDGTTPFDSVDVQQATEMCT